MRSLYTLLIILFCTIQISIAQNISDFEDVESLGEQGFFKEYFKGLFQGFTSGEPLTVSGGFGINTRTYSAWGLDDKRQPPFYWVMNANLNISVYNKLNIPFSALISVDRREFTPPPVPGVPNIKETVTNRFNRIGASPYYKWIKLHGGHRNMTFSKFTLSNLTYLGGGAELTPGKFRVAAMYGRLAEAEPQDLSLTQPNIPVFRRMGYGTKIGYGTSDHFIDFVYFKGWDDTKSIPEVKPQEVFANENVVLGLKGQTKLFKKFTVKLDLAKSALTPNIQDTLTDNSTFPFPDFLIKERTSTTYRRALETGVDYQAEGFNIGVNYRRIDPEYKTLGAYFFNNDIEDFTGRASWGMFKQQLQFNVSAGLQRDNLDDSKVSTLTRFIGSADVNFSKDDYSLGFNYSNYSSDIQYVLDQDLDSLNVVVVTQDLGFTGSYILPSKDKEKIRQTITATTNFQTVNDDLTNASESSDSRMMNANLMYAITFTESKWGINANCNYNTNELSMIDTKRWGAGFGITKSLLENKMNLGFNLNYFQAKVNTITILNNNTLNIRLNSTYALKNNHKFNFNYTLLNRVKKGNGSTDSFTEGIANLGYQYNFSWKPFKKKSKEQEQK